MFNYNVLYSSIMTTLANPIGLQNNNTSVYVDTKSRYNSKTNQEHTCTD